jgi:hypothetical protein
MSRKPARRHDLHTLTTTDDIDRLIDPTYLPARESNRRPTRRQMSRKAFDDLSSDDPPRRPFTASSSEEEEEEEAPAPRKVAVLSDDDDIEFFQARQKHMIELSSDESEDEPRMRSQQRRQRQVIELSEESEDGPPMRSQQRRRVPIRDDPERVPIPGPKRVVSKSRGSAKRRTAYQGNKAALDYANQVLQDPDLGPPSQSGMPVRRPASRVPTGGAQ